MKKESIVGLFIIFLMMIPICIGQEGTLPAEEPRDKIIAFGRCYYVSGEDDGIVNYGMNSLNDAYVRISHHPNGIVMIRSKDSSTGNSIIHIFNKYTTDIIELADFTGTILYFQSGWMFLIGLHQNMQIVSWF